MGPHERKDITLNGGHQFATDCSLLPRDPPALKPKLPVVCDLQHVWVDGRLLDDLRCSHAVHGGQLGWSFFSSVLSARTVGRARQL
eukprot:83316-Pelagomonas_calceolata.AAC.8